MTRIANWCINAAIVFIWTAAIALAALYTVALEARGHKAPSGWKYPLVCCSRADCAPVTKHGEKGGLRTMTPDMHGEVAIPNVHWKSVQGSGDDSWHLCATPGKDVPHDRRTIFCIFAPNGA